MSIQIVREISTDLFKRGATKTVNAKQNDLNSRFLNVRIQNEGKNIVVDPDVVVAFNVERPDKQKKVFKGSVNTDGTVRVPLTSWVLEVEGTLTCDISIIFEDPNASKITTMQFNIQVEAATVNDETIADSEDYSLIVDLLAKTGKALYDAEQSIKACTLSKEAADAATERANTASAEVEHQLSEGVVPYVGENGNWFVGLKDTGIRAKALDGHATFIRYSEHADGTDMRADWDDTCFYMGIAFAREAPTDKESYEWIRVNIRGDHKHVADDVIDSVRCVAGSYVGTGTRGNLENKIILTFDFNPKVVIFYTAQSKVSSGTPIFYRTPSAFVFAGTYLVCLTDNHDTWSLFTWGDNQVSWYGASDATASEALNASGTTYYYVAIG